MALVGHHRLALVSSTDRERVWSQPKSYKVSSAGTNKMTGDLTIIQPRSERVKDARVHVWNPG